MRHFYFRSILLCFSFLSIEAQTTAVDPFFEAELINLGIDTNGATGDILDSDAQAVTNLDLSGATNITDITGINAFVNVTDLDLGDNQVIDISVTGLTQLINFTSDNNDAIAVADFSQNTLLQTVYLESQISGGAPYPSITVLDFSQNVNLIELDVRFFRNVTDLILPVTNTLTDVYLANLADETLDFSLLDGLIDVDVRGSQAANVVITLPTEPLNLEEIYFSSIDFNTPLDFSQYVNLVRVDLFSTDPEELILPTTNTFRSLTIWGHNFLAPYSLANVPEVEYVDIRGFSNTVPLVIDLQSNPLIRTLWLVNNEMVSVDLTNITELRTLYIYDNELTVLDLTQNLNLRSADASRNLLPGIDLTQNVELQNLTLSNNLITNIDLTQNVNLNSLRINNNLLTTTGTDLTQNIVLSSLDVSFNQIESLDITQNVELFSFNLSHNLFPGNDILNQYADIVTAQGRLRGRLIANNNLLEGPIPSFFDLYDPTVQTRRFELFINENNFHFGDFESQHLGLVSLLTTQSIGPSPDVVMREYWYAPQAKVDVIENLTVNAGDDITLTTTVRGEQNHYVWFKDGVQIPDAPDAPEYTITNVNSCDTAVYYSEIRSDLVPFENANPSGTDGKNLLLVRNDITLNVNSPTEACVNLSSPIDGSTNVPLNQTLTWAENTGACGYFVSIGTTAGGTDIANNVDVGDIESYNVGTNFPSNTEIFVTITPYFVSGTTLNCTEESFTTNTTESPAACTNLTAQYANQELPTTTNLEWLPADFATGYFVTIGTSPNGNEVYDMLDNGNSTFFNPPADFNEGETYYVTITPYNNLGNTTGCPSEAFTTPSNVVLPVCTTLNTPADGSTNVAVNTDLTWDTATDTIGYFISIGTSSGATDVLNNFDNGNNIAYNPTSDLDINTTYYVTVTPYNANGNATGCAETSFTTVLPLPTCTTVTSQTSGETDVAMDTDFSWSAVANASGYVLNIGTTSDGTEIFSGNVGNITSYDLASDLPQNTQIFVSVIPTNASGDATGCTEISFTTELLIPNCTTMLLSPNTTTDVPITTNLQWDTTANADGYILTVGTMSGGNDIVNAEDVGNTNNYTFASDLPQGETVFVNIIPYNATGNAINCTEYIFTTEILPIGCTNMSFPTFDAINVPLDTSISWPPSANTTGYRISLGTATGLDDIFPLTDLGNSTTFTPPSLLPSSTTIYVTIISYNDFGDDLACGDDRFTTTEVIPECTNLITPLDNSTNVSINTILEWNAVSNATGYIVNVGTLPDGTDIINAEDVGNITNYTFASALPQDTEIFVSIHPYNAIGINQFCVGPLFTTELLIPECTDFTMPINGEINVPVNTTFSWNSIFNASGYLLSIGTSSGGNNVLNNEDVNNVTTYNLDNILESETQFFATIIPYNSEGEAIGCNEIVFETEVILPDCPDIFQPLSNETDVSVETIISWDAIFNAEGYIISIGTTPTGNEIVENLDVGTDTSYNHSTEYPDDTTLYVTLVVYNSVGNSVNCITHQFITENRSIIIPKFFTPNNDSRHDFWQVEDPKNEIKVIYIFDRFGKLIGSFSPNSSGWNGTYNGIPLNTDDYWYQIELIDGKAITGHFTLKR